MKILFIYRCQFVNVTVLSTERSQPELLRELGETWICQKWHVAQKLVATVTDLKKKNNLLGRTIIVNYIDTHGSGV